MRVKLKGVHSATKVLSSGQKVRYFYAWKGGPRILAKPGTEAFMQELLSHRAKEKTVRRKEDTLADLIQQFLSSSDFTSLKAPTQKKKKKKLPYLP
jgi:hypothetical protein